MAVNRSRRVGLGLCLCALTHWACGAKIASEFGATEQSGGTAATSNGGTTAASSGGFVAVATGAGGAISGGGLVASPSPLCGITLAGEATAKGISCTLADVQLCYKACGPQSIGFKSETCSGGVYTESVGCNYPEGYDYSCYKIPAVFDASCPVSPLHNTPCTVVPCVACVSTVAVSGYPDPSSSAPIAYCICALNATAGVYKWSCAQATAWPCPGRYGC